MAGDLLLERPFFDTHADTLHELFVALGREEEWRDSPEALLPYTQAKWVGQEHGNSGEKDQFDPDREAAAKALMPELGLQQAVMPSAGTYEQTVIVGGMMRVNRQRIAFTKQLLDTGRVEIGRMVFWAGQRHRDYRDDAQLGDMDLETLATGDDWVRAELVKLAGPAPEEGFATETGLARLAYLESFKHARVARTGGGAYTFTAADYPDFTLLDCPAIERPKGPPRHTTESCTGEWLDAEAPSENARVLIVAGNPHTLRTCLDIGNAAERHNRSDIRFDVCGPSANPAASIQLYLGEIGRLLYMDAVGQEEPAANVS